MAPKPAPSSKQAPATKHAANTNSNQEKSAEPKKPHNNPKVTSSPTKQAAPPPPDLPNPVSQDSLAITEAEPSPEKKSLSKSTSHKQELDDSAKSRKKEKSNEDTEPALHESPVANNGSTPTKPKSQATPKHQQKAPQTTPPQESSPSPQTNSKKDSSAKLQQPSSKKAPVVPSLTNKLPPAKPPADTKSLPIHIQSVVDEAEIEEDIIADEKTHVPVLDIKHFRKTDAKDVPEQQIIEDLAEAKEDDLELLAEQRERQLKAEKEAQRLHELKRLSEEPAKEVDEDIDATNDVDGVTVPQIRIPKQDDVAELPEERITERELRSYRNITGSSISNDPLQSNRPSARMEYADDFDEEIEAAES